jgi:hypothetical protein
MRSVRRASGLVPTAKCLVGPCCGVRGWRCTVANSVSLLICLPYWRPGGGESWGDVDRGLPSICKPGGGVQRYAASFRGIGCDIRAVVLLG